MSGGQLRAPVSAPVSRWSQIASGAAWIRWRFHGSRSCAAMPAGGSRWRQSFHGSLHFCT